MVNDEHAQAPEEPKKGGKWKLIVGALVLVVVVGAVVFGAQGGLFQGKIFRFDKEPQVAYEGPTVNYAVMNQSYDSKLPADDFTPPADDSTPPADDSTPPADDFTPPADDFTPPADDSTPTVDETVNNSQGVLSVSLSTSSPSGSRAVSPNDRVASFDLCATDNYVTVTGLRLVISGVLELPVIEIKDGSTVLGATNDWSTLNDLYIDTSFSSDLVISEGTCTTVSVDLDSTGLINDHQAMDDIFQVGLEDVFVTGNVFFQNSPIEAYELYY